MTGTSYRVDDEKLCTTIHYNLTPITPSYHHLLYQDSKPDNATPSPAYFCANDPKALSAFSISPFNLHNSSLVLATSCSLQNA